MYRILIVEDDEGIAEGVEHQICGWGFEARCAADFRDVIGEFLAFDPQLVLMDIGLPFLTDIIGVQRSESCPVYRLFFYRRRRII